MAGKITNEQFLRAYQKYPESRKMAMDELGISEPTFYRYMRNLLPEQIIREPKPKSEILSRFFSDLSRISKMADGTNPDIGAFLKTWRNLYLEGLI